jgi:hypothetical protein
MVHETVITLSRASRTRMNQLLPICILSLRLGNTLNHALDRPYSGNTERSDACSFESLGAGMRRSAST